MKRLIYMSMPDGAQQEGRSGVGILIFDIDAGHKFVRRIEIPIFSEGLRGFTGSAKTRCVYYSTTNRRLGCFDVEKEKVVWEKTYDAGCDRSSITTDGKKIYVPTGWWYSTRGVSSRRAATMNWSSKAAFIPGCTGPNSALPADMHRPRQSRPTNRPSPWPASSRSKAPCRIGCYGLSSPWWN